jgi:glycosyltransferase involved in cell wall biosynthesis
MADKLTGNRQAEKNIVFNNGLYIDHFRKEFSGDVFKIVFVGRLVQQKSPMVFLESIKHINKFNIPFEVSILGDGILRDKMEEFILANSLFNVNMKGKVSHSDVYKELSSSHVLISSSESEGMSLAILEAISAGVYVVATPASRNAEMIIEDINGNLVGFNKPDAIAEKVRSFYETKFTRQYKYPDDYLQKMGDQYSWSSIAKNYERLFVKMMAGEIAGSRG